MPVEEYSSIKEVAEKIKNDNNKVTLLYGFNGVGKTRLSMEFKDLINSNRQQEDEVDIIYYNAYTEDLFTWDNDLINDSERKIKINLESGFLDFLNESGRHMEIARKFKELTFSKIEPNIDINTGVVTFNLPTGDSQSRRNIKISRGEESVFIWTVFYIYIQSIVGSLNDNEDKYSDLKYIYIDDPVSSLDDNHIMELAYDLKELINSSENEDLKFVISTHHALFFNTLFNLFKKEEDKKCYLLKKDVSENKYKLFDKNNDYIFSYHLLLKEEIENAIKENRLKKYHFNLFRNLLEKTAAFLGYDNWSYLLKKHNREIYTNKINHYSHNRVSDLETQELEIHEENLLKTLFDEFKIRYRWRR